MSKPTEKFNFNGNFNVGGAPSGENENTIVKGISKLNVKDGDNEEEEDNEDEEDYGDVFANLPKEVINRIKTIRNMHNEVEEIDSEYKLERIALEKKYIAKKETLNTTRTKIISGEIDPPVLEEAESSTELTTEGSDIRGIPGFWLTVLTSHPHLGELITEEDVPALESLADIKVSYDDTFTSFVLTFTFNPNEYFNNTELTKKYVVNPDLLDDKAPALSEVDGSVIEWKEGKNLTVTEVKKKQKAKSGKNKGQVRTVVTTENKSSFFWYFSDPLTEEEEAEIEEKEEEDESTNVKLSMEEDYEIGHTFRTSIIPEAVLWYTQEAIEEDEDGEEDEDDEDLEDDEDEEDEEEDEEEESPKYKGNKKGGPSTIGNKNKLSFTPEGGFKAAGGDKTGATEGGDKQPECKQN